MIATITLNPSIDQLITVPSLVKDDANRAETVSYYPGGKGLNVSKVIRELGGPTHAYALIGGFVGEYWKHLVRSLDIPFSGMPVLGETRINAVLTDVKDQTQTRISAPGPCAPPKTVRAFLKKLVSARPKPCLWALGGSLAKGMPADTYREFVSVLQSGGIDCILDTDNEALRLGIQAKPFMIKPNEYEIARLVGRPLKKIPDYLKAARELNRRGVRIVVISLGAKGALFVTPDEAFHALGVKVPVKSKVGAGDSLIGGFSLGLCREKSLRQAAAWGIAASTSAVMREAPRLCLRSDIPKLSARIVFKTL